MLLMVKKTKYFRDLDRVLLFISRILRYVEKSGGRLNEESFKIALGKAGEWFLSIKEKNVKEGFEGLFKRTQSDCRKIRQAFLNDVRFARNINSDSFEFKTPHLDKELKETLKSFLTPFYEYILGQRGFEKIKNLSTNVLTREMVRIGYISENSKCCCVCPACLGGINLKVNEDKLGEKDIYAQLDHYLPQHNYPALIISSDNLVPVCRECNSPDVKGGTDPIEEHVAGCTSGIFLPYKDCGMEYISIEFGGGGGTRKVSIEAKNKIQPFMDKKVENFKKIYKLQGRWTGRIETIHDTIVTDISTDMEGMEGEWDEESIRGELIKIIKRAEKKQKTTPDSYLQKCYAEWLLSKKFKELCDEIRTRIEEENKSQ